MPTDLTNLTALTDLWVALQKLWAWAQERLPLLQAGIILGMQVIEWLRKVLAPMPIPVPVTK